MATTTTTTTTSAAATNTEPTEINGNNNNNNYNDSNIYDNKFMIQVNEKLPTVEECYRFVLEDNGSSGAVSTFVGITRDNFQNKKVIKLSYEGYISMAIKELYKLCCDACVVYSTIQKIALVHIIGDCPVGEASVIITTSSPHRYDAMHCTEYLINELKKRIPIWKLEVYQDNGNNNGEGTSSSVWKENIETREMEKM